MSTGVIGTSGEDRSDYTRAESKAIRRRSLRLLGSLLSPLRRELALAAGVLFGAFCFGGLLLFAEPGPAPFILVELPLGRDLVFRFPF